MINQHIVCGQSFSQLKGFLPPSCQHVTGLDGLDPELIRLYDFCSNF